MSIERKYEAVIYIVAIVVISAIFIFARNSDNDSMSATDPAVLPVKKLLFEMQHYADENELAQEQMIDRANDILEELPSDYNRLKHQYQIALSALPKVVFYGRVVDQYGRPVAGAEVIYIGTSTYLSAGGGRGKVVTDSDGYFEIDTKGERLNVGSVIHPQIEYSHHFDGGYGREIKQSRLKSTKQFLSYDDETGIHDNWRKYSDRNHPYLIRAWRLGEYEGAIQNNVQGFFSSNGDVFTLNLTGKSYQEIVKKGKTTGHLYVSCTRRSMENAKDYGDWAATITPVDGGIQETSDVYMNIAPEAGYRSSISIDMRQENDDYQPGLANKRYFFTANSGEDFGSLYVHFEPHGKYEDDRYCIIDITYKINSNGSRNLELEKEASSQPSYPNNWNNWGRTTVSLVTRTNKNKLTSTD